MDSNESTAAQSTTPRIGLIDVNDISLRDLLRPDDDTVLGEALRHAVGAVAGQPADAVSAFNSAI